MGNQNSNTNKEQPNDELKPKNISQILDYIATYYILTMDFKSLKNLYDKEYCDKMVILTSDIIERYFTNMEITYLAQRIKNGVEVNEIDKNKIIFFNRDELSKLDIKNSIKKKRICLSIAKFYIKIAHVFASIVTTINPVYVYKDAEGKTVRASLYEKGKIPINTPRDIYKLNICDNRINSLTNKYSLEPNDKGDITIGPKVCDFNIRDDGKDKTLEDEPGIPELIDLYYDDNYDYKTGKFTNMSAKTRELFQDDLKIFYSVFTNKQIIPSNITKFSDIKLRDYHNIDQCKGDNPKFERKVTGPLSDNLINKYAKNLKQMIVTANKNQQQLLTIINKLFVYSIDPQTGKKQIRVTPSLTEEELQEIVVETRALIIKLYLTCEVDYVNSLNLYEAIIDKKIIETSQSQIANLGKMLDNLVTEEVPQSAELQEIKRKSEEKIDSQKADIEKQLTHIKKTEQFVQEFPTEIPIDTSIKSPTETSPTALNNN